MPRRTASPRIALSGCRYLMTVSFDGPRALQVTDQASDPVRAALARLEVPDLGKDDAVERVLATQANEEGRSRRLLRLPQYLLSEMRSSRLRVRRRQSGDLSSPPSPVRSSASWRVRHPPTRRPRRGL